MRNFAKTDLESPDTRCDEYDQWWERQHHQSLDLPADGIEFVDGIDAVRDPRAGEVTERDKIMWAAYRAFADNPYPLSQIVGALKTDGRINFAMLAWKPSENVAPLLAAWPRENLSHNHWMILSHHHDRLIQWLYPETPPELVRYIDMETAVFFKAGVPKEEHSHDECEKAYPHRALRRFFLERFTCGPAVFHLCHGCGSMLEMTVRPARIPDYAGRSVGRVME